MEQLNSIFDTETYTKKYSVSNLNYVRTKIVCRSEVSRSTGYSRLQLNISSQGERRRIPLNLFVIRSLWDKQKIQVASDHPNAHSLNLVIANFESKITQIRTKYELMRKTLTVNLLEEEFVHGIPRVYFIAYMEYRLELMSDIKKGTRRRYTSIINKLKKYNEKLTFHDIDNSFPDKYSKWCQRNGNMQTTIESNLRAIKDFLLKAKQDRVFFPMVLDRFKVKRTATAREYLQPSEVQRLQKYFFSEFINKDRKKVLAYFLAACYTGRRISEILDFKRKQFDETNSSIISKKTGKKQTIATTGDFKILLEEVPDLFINHLTAEHINREIKKICSDCKIQKTVSMHVGRHTFATTFIRNKVSDVTDLQVILGHSNIRETMLYVKMVDEETIVTNSNLNGMYN